MISSFNISTLIKIFIISTVFLFGILSYLFLLWTERDPKNLRNILGAMFLALIFTFRLLFFGAVVIVLLFILKTKI